MFKDNRLKDLYFVKWFSSYQKVYIPKSASPDKIIDGFVKSRLSHENGNPEKFKIL